MASDKVRARAARMSPETRRTLQVVGPLLLLVGFLLFLNAPFQMFFGSSGLGMSDAGWFEAESKRMGFAALGAFVGMALLGVGGFLTQLGFLKLGTEIVATETEVAVEHAAGSIGRGLAGAGIGAGSGGARVMLKCRGCGALDTEDAKFCSACGALM